MTLCLFSRKRRKYLKTLAFHFLFLNYLLKFTGLSFLHFFCVTLSPFPNCNYFSWVIHTLTCLFVIIRLWKKESKSEANFEFLSNSRDYTIIFFLVYIYLFFILALFAHPFMFALCFSSPKPRLIYSFRFGSAFLLFQFFNLVLDSKLNSSLIFWVCFR